MRNLKLPAQGMTNIPAGVEKSLGIIKSQEMSHINSKSKEPRTHHILILLSDGHHNTGQPPEKVFPNFTSILPEDTKLSTIVVGFSQQSSTSMGMLLKKSIETITFQADVVQTIYFAKSQTALKSALGSLETGLNNGLKGSFHEIRAESKSIIQDFASEPKEKVRVHMKPDSNCITLLCAFDQLPKTIHVNGHEVHVSEEEEVSFESLSALIQGLIDRTKVKIVAATNRSQLIAKSVKRLEGLYKILQANKAQEVNLDLKSLSAKERVKQYREIRTLCHEAAALKNQILDIANFSNNDSESQASFLNGRSMKYANKALRRAAKRDDRIVDPKAQQKAMHKYLTSTDFHSKLQDAMMMDVVENLRRLPEQQILSNIFPIVISRQHMDQIWEIRRKATSHAKDDESSNDIDKFGLSLRSRDLITSGKLAEYLNEGLHGNRQSYVSMATPWQHLEEWMHFEDQPFDSTWEMLMYGGCVGYPLFVERIAASQMNPFLLQVQGVHCSLVDSASICCANQAEVPVYGPEAGKPIEDVLVLIDPSLPRSSKLIYNTALMGENFTSATVARDLHMYSGINMRIALHANTLFHLMASNDEATKTEDDVVASLRRAFLGRAFMCPKCNVGPVNHFACGDLMAHHGESVRGTEINNACPNCSWFSSSLMDWLPWDGNVSEDYLQAEMKESPNKRGRDHFLSEARIDMILRVVYSFRKLCRDSSVWEQYQELVDRMMAWPETRVDFSTKAGVDGLSQLAMALLGVLSETEDPKQVFKSTNVLISILKEACARDARKRFRQESTGNKEIARQKAMEFCTKLLGIEQDTVPQTLPPFESEPPIENVRVDCRDDYQLNLSVMQQIIPCIRDICRKWCRVWSLAEALSSILTSRRGGWEQLERDMETSTLNYQDVVEKLKETPLKTPRDLLVLSDISGEGCDLSELQNFFLRLAVEAIVLGAAESALPSSAEEEEEDDLLCLAAREMRMRLYLQRVATKMAQWKLEGQRATWLQARATDIQQYSDLIQKSHVHGLDKQTFWGLWLAAVESQDRAKAEAFLATSNEEFRNKHGRSSWETRHSRKK